MKQTILDVEFPRAGSGEERSSGIHLTDLIHGVLDELGYYKKSTMPEDRLNMAAEMGFNFEVALQAAWAGRLGTRPGEIVCDGIACSPDGIGEYQGADILEEYKCTRYSANRAQDIESMRPWMMQIKGYLKALGIGNRCLLRVLWIDGDYSFPRRFLYNEILLEFTREEIEDNWQYLLSYGKSKGWL